jgi:hypothetical protein
VDKTAAFPVRFRERIALPNVRSGTSFSSRIVCSYTFGSHGTTHKPRGKLGEPSMLRMILSALALAVLVTGLGMSGADAKAKHKKKVAVAAAGCTASPIMRDESRLLHCWPMKKK